MNSKDWKEYLILNLPESNAAQRQLWASQLLSDQLDLAELFPLFFVEGKTAIRFSWFVSDIGAIESKKLIPVLAHIRLNYDKLQHFPIDHSITRYLLLSGIPEDNAGFWVDHLMHLVKSSDTKNFVKKTALKILVNYCAQYPELKQELDLINQFTRSKK